MASPAKDVATLLQTEGLGTLGTDLFYSREPAKSGVIVTVYDLGGRNDANAKWLREYPEVQIRVKGTPNDYSSAWDKIQAIKDVLLGHDPVVINSEWNYIGVWINGDPIHLGNSEDDRAIIISSWRLVRELYSDTGNRLAM